LACWAVYLKINIFSLLLFFKMKSFYQNWLRKNNEENKEVKNLTKSPALSTIEVRNRSPIPSTSAQASIIQPVSPVRSDLEENTMAASNSPKESTVPKQTDIIFENEQFILYMQKEAFLRQKRFNFQDHLFHLKIKLKNNSDIPFLRDILDFLEQGLLHVMENIKTFYKEEDANVCFLTLFQEPMVNALNSGG
jgi:hypothetical protein